MAELKQLAGVLNVQIYKGNTRDIELDWNINLVGYTFMAKIVNATTGALIVAVPVIVVDLAAGQITLKITDAVALATPIGVHKLLLDWVDPDTLIRTVTAGTYEVSYA